MTKDQIDQWAELVDTKYKLVLSDISDFLDPKPKKR